MAGSFLCRVSYSRVYESGFPGSLSEMPLSRISLATCRLPETKDAIAQETFSNLRTDLPGGREATAPLVAHDPLGGVLGHEAVSAGIASPEITNQIVRQIGGRLRSHHGVCTDRAGRQITPARIGVRRDGRQDLSNSWHRGTPLRSTDFDDLIHRNS